MFFEIIILIYQPHINRNIRIVAHFHCPFSKPNLYRFIIKFLLNHGIRVFLQFIRLKIGYIDFNRMKLIAIILIILDYPYF